MVCDIDNYEVHTNFTGYPATRFAFTISEIANPTAETKKRLGGRTPMAVLRAVFEDPQSLRPDRSSAAITEELAEQIGELAKELRREDNEAHAVAHFLMQIVFCFFAEDVGEFLQRDIHLVDMPTGLVAAL